MRSYVSVSLIHTFPRLSPQNICRLSGVTAKQVTYPSFEPVSILIGCGSDSLLNSWEILVTYVQFEEKPRFHDTQKNLSDLDDEPIGVDCSRSVRMKEECCELERLNSCNNRLELLQLPS